MVSPILSLTALATCLGNDADSSFDAMARTMMGIQVSTAFSGIAAPETSLVNIAQYLVSVLVHAVCLDDFSLSAMWACEIDKCCQVELLGSKCLR